MSVTLLRPLQISTRRASQFSRPVSNKVHKLPTPGDENDFRPPWFYTMARMLSWTLIPAAGLWGVFAYDFGERDHVFRPARRWLDRQKATFLTLSPEEQKIVDVDSEPPSVKTT